MTIITIRYIVGSIEEKSARFVMSDGSCDKKASNPILKPPENNAKYTAVPIQESICGAKSATGIRAGLLGLKPRFLNPAPEQKTASRGIKTATILNRKRNAIVFPILSIYPAAHIGIAAAPNATGIKMMNLSLVIVLGSIISHTP